MRGIESYPFLEREEEVFLSNQGLFKERLRSGWKPGHFYLTNKRLVCFSPPKIKFQIQLDDIVNLSVQKVAVILKSAHVLMISYKIDDKGRPLEVWMVLKDLQTWARRLYERSLLRIDEETIDKIAKELDSDSRAVLIYLWQNRHARIEELAELIDAPNHMDILFRIREVINPTAEKVLGYSILSFEKSKVDGETGRKITFSWWITRKKVLKEEDARRPILDIFDERDHLTVVVELLGVREEDILLKIERDRFELSATGKGIRYQEEVVLPALIDVKRVTKIYNNNILELRLEKMGEG